MLKLYLPDVKVPFQVSSNDSVEFLWGVQRVLTGLCGDLKPADWHQQKENTTLSRCSASTPLDWLG